MAYVAVVAVIVVTALSFSFRLGYFIIKQGIHLPPAVCAGL